MGSPENPDWLLDCSLIDEIPVSGGDFEPAGNTGFYWQPQGYNGSSGASEGNELVDVNAPTDSCSRKRARTESSDGPCSKACREKMRRDRLNDKFLELASILETGKPPKMDKAAILSDAVRSVTLSRSEAQKLKDSNESLQEKIRELKTEKKELRDEKQKLKAEKEGLEHQIKAMNMHSSFLPHPPIMPTPFVAAGQAPGGKLMMPFIGYPGFMYPFQSPATLDEKNELPPAA